MMRIYLLGFMGAGKTYWGNLWAKDLGISFTDLDKKIEFEEGMLIEDIFEKRGEEYFRKLESTILRGTAQENNCIIATGGGTPCFYGNMGWMNRHGITIFLDASPTYLFNRLKSDETSRPLLKNQNESEIKFFIEKKMEERMPFYSQARLCLPCQEITINTLRGILPLINKNNKNA
ncbi:MAG: shikimate kinase [Chitinophagaceae bacterium]|nr:shikimate kinase [Bacteroidota bacterium]MCC6258713.1 shikimate kinase [Chitinophagaceae bacterium]MCW5916066.1 shikimate kinase [Ferruginibacter sp.]